MHITPDARLHELGVELPRQLPVIGSYQLARRHRGIVYVAGHVSMRLDHSDLPLNAAVETEMTVALHD